MEMRLSDLINYQNNHSRLQFIQKYRKNIIPFVGAGISIECGLYSWLELLDKLAQNYLTPQQIKSHHKQKDYFKYADGIVDAAGNPNLIMKEIRELFQSSPIRFTKSPHIIVSSFSELIVTTNYDTILETTSQQSANNHPLKPLLPCLKGQVDEAIQVNDRCLLKLHGSIEETSSFILTSKQYDEFYGVKGTNETKPLPLFLEKIFSGKKILFIGCSLEIDRTLDILCECVNKYERITHFAIVPWLTNEKKRINRARQLSRMGIEPIYYPEGDYSAVGKLLSYLAQENDFLTFFKNLIVSNIFPVNTQPDLAKALCDIVQQSFFETATEHPEILDDMFTPKKVEIEKYVNEHVFPLHTDGTLYSIVLRIINSYFDISLLLNKSVIKAKFEEVFSDHVLKESISSELLEKKLSLSRHFNSGNLPSKEWVLQLSHEEINLFAKELLSKLQYKNGMSFTDIAQAYSMAKQLEDQLGSKIEKRTRTRLLNSIGAFSSYFKDCYNGERYLETAISLIRDTDTHDRTEYLFLAKCYYNLALVLAYNGDHKESLRAISEDMRIKKEYNESPQLYARTCDLYATLLSENNPFEAGTVYMEVATIKGEYAKLSYDDESASRDMVASWATVIFNIGLLARDLELYQLSYSYIIFANELRFKTVDKNNKDYCSALNVQAELELLLNIGTEAKNIVAIIEAKQNLPEGFSQIMGHTWYVCAYYYFSIKEYKTAFYYAIKSLDALSGNDLKDAKQTLKCKMLMGAVVREIKNDGSGYGYPSPEKIYSDVINEIKLQYGDESFYLVLPYRFLSQNSLDNDRKNSFEQQYYSIHNKYYEQRKALYAELIKYLQSLNPDISIIPDTLIL